MNASNLSANDNEAAFPVGTIYETAAWRIQRFRSCVMVWPLANAGKRGKTVVRRTLSSDRSGVPFESICLELQLWANRNATEAQMDRALQENADVFGEKVDRFEEKGVRVSKTVKRPIRIETDRVSATFETDDFHIRHVGDVNETTSLPFGKRGVDKLYAAVASNPKALESMSYAEVRDLAQSFAEVHEYCAMD
jgi:hypothetical protein